MTTTIIETGALERALRTLKLSGMLDTIDARLAQARAGELGHIEFLQTSRALAHLAGGHADGTWHKRLGELARPAVLILDDFAMRGCRPPSR